MKGISRITHFSILLVLGFLNILFAANRVTITDRSGATQANYPVQIARPFIQGEIAHFPQALLNGTPVLTQADVKMRYADGSAKHAILSFIIPSLAANGTVTVSFQDQSTGNNTALTQAEMLNAAYDFDAGIRLDSGAQTPQTVSARAMLSAGKYTCWTSGPVATTIILADHSVSRTYDMGFDSLRSLRPIFHATFWPALHKVRVRFIGENIGTTSMKDFCANLTLTTGSASPQTVYTRDTLKIYAGTRWTKEYWIGGAPSEQVDINHNLAYLARTRFFPNYDTTLTVTAAAAQTSYNNWIATSRGLYEPGLWTKYMPTTGGRDDIGPYPAWALLWLYTGDYRARAVTLGQADLAGAWPLHLRESDTTKRLDSSRTVPGVGRIVSIYSYPNLWYPDNNGNYFFIKAPRITVTGYPTTFGSWSADGAHQADPYSAAYTLTGDYWYLEQAQQWAATMALGYAPAYRGPAPSAAIIDQTRGNAWILRNRVNAAFLTPDNDPEKGYFNDIINHAITFWEGERKITGTSFQGTRIYNWFNTKTAWNPPLRFWSEGTIRAGDGIDTSVASMIETVWQDYFLIFELGRALEMGYPTGAVLNWLAPVLTAQYNAPNYNRYMLQAYKTMTRDRAGVFVQTWEQTVAGYSNKTWNPVSFSWGQDDYSCYAFGALSMCMDQTDGLAMWKWMKSAVYDPNRTSFNGYPKWAIMPRDTVPAAVETVSLSAGLEPLLFVSPNPFNASISLRLQTLSSAQTSPAIKVYDVRGKCVADLTCRALKEKVVWNAVGKPSGIYIVKVITGSGTLTRRITLLK